MSLSLSAFCLFFQKDWYFQAHFFFLYFCWRFRSMQHFGLTHIHRRSKKNKKGFIVIPQTDIRRKPEHFWYQTLLCSLRSVYRFIWVVNTRHTETELTKQTFTWWWFAYWLTEWHLMRRKKERISMETYIYGKVHNRSIHDEHMPPSADEAGMQGSDWVVLWPDAINSALRHLRGSLHKRPVLRGVFPRDGKRFIKCRVFITNAGSRVIKCVPIYTHVDFSKYLGAEINVSGSATGGCFGRMMQHACFCSSAFPRVYSDRQ